MSGTVCPGAYALSVSGTNALDGDGQTDIVWRHEVSGKVVVWLMNGVERSNIDLTEVSLFSHGTTVATNALITRNFPAAALVTTRGFRDVLEIRDGTKDDLWDAYNDVSAPYIRRRDRFDPALGQARPAGSEARGDDGELDRGR